MSVTMHAIMPVHPKLMSIHQSMSCNEPTTRPPTRLAASLALVADGGRRGAWSSSALRGRGLAHSAVLLVMSWSSPASRSYAVLLLARLGCSELLDGCREAAWQFAWKMTACE